MIELAFILAKSAQVLPGAVVEQAGKLGMVLEYKPAAQDNPLGFDIEGGGTLFVMPIAARHPDVEHLAQLLTAPEPEEVAAHQAHIIVTAYDLVGEELARQLTMTLLTAAVARATDAVGAMLKSGIGFHRAEVFADLAEVAAEYGDLPPQLALDVTLAPEPAQRMSLLTHGMRRRGLEEILVTCSRTGEGAEDFLYSIAGWLLEEPTKRLPTGDTVGRDSSEKVTVQRVPNPSGEPGEVIKLDLDLAPILN
jgi:hypothetical protein